MTKVIIFGIRDLAELAHYYLSSDNEHKVVAFSVNQEYLLESHFYKGLPVIGFENIEKKYLPSDYMFFAPMTHSNYNKDREKIYNEIKNKGYKLISYVHPKAIVDSSVIIGDNCFILESAVIQPFVTVGNNNIIWSSTTISHHTKLHDNIFIAPSVSVSGNCVIESNCFLGIGCIVRDNITIKHGCYIAMGSCLTDNTLQNSFYKGIPAKFIQEIE
jgi:sugar O-acyltransferase (sialic acid O-acetyltransferase NeuD family)